MIIGSSTLHIIQAYREFKNDGVLHVPDMWYAYNNCRYDIPTDSLIGWVGGKQGITVLYKETNTNRFWKDKIDKRVKVQDITNLRYSCTSTVIIW